MLFRSSSYKPEEPEKILVASASIHGHTRAAAHTMAEKLDKLPADLKREIEDKVTRLKEAVSKKDITAIKAGKEDLESRLEALYKAAEAAQQSAGAAGPMPGAPAEEEPSDGPRKAKGRVVDAEIVDDDK